MMQRLKYYVYDIIQREKYKKLREVKCFEQSAAWEFGWQAAVIPVSQTLIITNFGYF